MDVGGIIFLRRIANWRQHSLFWPVTIIISLLLVLQLVRLVLILLTPVAPIGGWQPTPAQIIPVAARTALLTRFNPFDGSSAAPAQQETAAVTALDLTLYGVRLNAASGGGSAIIAGSDGVQSSFAVDAEVLPGVTLAAVQFDHVVLDRNGSRERLYLDQSGDIIPVSAPPTGADAAQADADEAVDGQAPTPLPAGTAALGANSISFAPRSVAGRITGIAVSPKGDGSAFEKWGFRNGDVIVEYDGRPVRSADDMAAIIAKSRPGGRFSVMVERGGDILPIAIIVPEK